MKSNNNEELNNLEQQKQQIEKQITDLKRKTRHEQLKGIAQTMSRYEISLDELSKYLERREPVAKYLNPTTGQTWHGRGKKPVWIREILENNGNLEDYLINN